MENKSILGNSDGKYIYSRKTVMENISILGKQ